MRILFINQYYWPDVAATAQVLTEAAEALTRRGHEVTVICSRKSYGGDMDGEHKRLPMEEVHNEVRILRLPALGGGRRACFARRVLDFLSFYLLAGVRSVLLHRPDVVVTLTTPPMIGLVGKAMQILRGVPHIHWCMDTYPDLFVANAFIKEGGLLHQLFVLMARAYLRSCDAVIVLGPHMRVRIESYGPPPDRVHIVPLWADGRRLKPTPRKDNWFIKKHGLEEKFVVLYSGSLGLGETFDTVLDAAERLVDDTSVVFVFIALSPHRERLESKVRERGLANFLFLPYQDRQDLAFSLGAGHLHVVHFSPSQNGMKVSCKAYGILAVGGSVLYFGSEGNEVADIVQRHQIGFLVREGDVDGCVAAIRHARRAPGVLQGMSIRARRVFEKEHDLEVVMGRFDRLLREVSQERRETRSGRNDP